MFKGLLASIFFLFPIFLQDDGATRYVVRKHSNGNPYVVVYCVGPTTNRVKEELYYENGQLDYVGHYKNSVEHGRWTYYWENGNLKSEEFYIRGREDGTMYDYNEEGKKTTEYYYVKGTLVRETKLN